MLNLLKIAVTGGVASGKSTVCQFFKELGAYVIDVDLIVHSLLSPDSDLGKQIKNSLDLPQASDYKNFRKIIADKVFKNPDLLQKLEAILHPIVLKKINEQYSEVLESGQNTLFVVEIPLLFEIAQDKFYDKVITVLTDEESAIQRCAKKGLSQSEFILRMKRQTLPTKKAALSSYIIHNRGNLEDLKKQVIVIYQNLQNH